MSERRMGMSEYGRRARRTQPSSTRARHGDQVQVRRIGSFGVCMGAATVAMGSARIHRKPAPGLQSVASRPTARCGSYPAKRRGAGPS